MRLMVPIIKGRSPAGQGAFDFDTDAHPREVKGAGGGKYRPGEFVPKGPRLTVPTHSGKAGQAEKPREEPSSDEGFTVETARYAKGMFIVRAPSEHGFKSRAARLLGDGLRARWTNRDGGYVVSPAKLAKFRRLYSEGWDAYPVTGKLRPPDPEETD